MNITVTHRACAEGARRMLLALGAVFGLATFAHCSNGCLPAKDPTVAEQNYTTDIVACAFFAGYPGPYDHAEDMACRAKVDCKYGIGPCGVAQ